MINYPFWVKSYFKVMRNIPIRIVILIILLGNGTLIAYFFTRNAFPSQVSQFLSISTIIEQKQCIFNISSNVQIVNLSAPVSTNLTCMKTKTLLNHISTTLCLHDKSKDIYVSGAFNGNQSIFEEGYVTRILQLLISHPHLDFIDIGANIGTYTMYVAALGRFVMAIECFSPNIDRIHRAIQLVNVANRVVLVQNALFKSSGGSLRLSFDARNVGGQELILSGSVKNHTVNDPY